MNSGNSNPSTLTLTSQRTARQIICSNVNLWITEMGDPPRVVGSGIECRVDQPETQPLEKLVGYEGNNPPYKEKDRKEWLRE